MSSGGIVFQDFKPVPGFQLIQQPVNYHILFEIQADGETIRVTSFIIKVNEPDVRSCRSGITQKRMECSRLMGQIESKLEKIQRF